MEHLTIIEDRLDLISALIWFITAF